MGRRGGFTLMELMVALAILVSVTASAFLVFRSITRAWSTGELRTERYQQARLLFDLFSREIASSVSNARYPLIGVPRADPSPLHAEEAAGDELMFVGALPGRNGLVERGYWVNGEGDLLCHDEEPVDGDYGTGAQEVCGRGILGMRLRYFTGSAWADRWDPHASGELPRAVRVTLIFDGEPAEEFETVIHVPGS